MKKEENKMLEIIHNNCKKEQERRNIKEKKLQEEQEYGKKWCRRILITGIICVILEVATVIVERVI